MSVDTDEEFVLEEVELDSKQDLLDEVRRLNEQLATALTNERQAVNELAEFKQQVVEVSRRYAEEHDMCGVYDDCMEELGLPRRPQPWTVYVRVHYTQAVTVVAESYGEAKLKVGEARERTHLTLGVPFRCDDMEDADTYSSGFEWEVSEV